MRIDSCAISLAPSLLCLASARAAESANGPPEPMAHIPSSGSMTSPSPDSTNVLFASATTTLLSRRTHKTVVPCIRARDPSVGIRELYRAPEHRADHLFFLLVLAVLLTEVLFQRISRKKVRRQIDVIRATFPEHLVDLLPV